MDSDGDVCSPRHPSTWISLAVVLLVSASFPLPFRETGKHDRVAWRWWVQANVEAGVAPGEDGVPESFKVAPRQLWMGLATNLMVTVGWLYSPARARSTILSLWEPSDPEGRFCRGLVDYCWTKAAGEPCEPQVRATSADIHSFIQACRRAYRDLGEEERWLLEPYRTTGVIPDVVLFRREQQQPRSPPKPEAGGHPRVRISRQELVSVLNDSLQDSLMSEAFSSPPAQVVDLWSTFNVRAIPTIPSDWAAVGQAVRDSRIARFDGTPLLPPELFNISVEQLAHNEGPAADRIAVLPSQCAPMSLRSYAAFAKRHVRSGKKGAFSLAHWGLLDLPLPMELPASVDRELYIASLENSGADLCAVVNVNARRLPDLFSRLPPRLDQSLGLEEEILRVQPYLWLGATFSPLHWDVEAGVYMLLSGHADVVLFDQSLGHTDIVAALRKVPSHLVHLRPGNGLVIPSRSSHIFFVQSSQRIALNFFLQPGWRRMEFSNDSWHAQQAGKPLGVQHLALHQLFLRSVIRLYEETGKGIFFVHAKNELL